MRILNISWRKWVLPCVLALAPAHLFAVDGVVLIDQSRALAGNITAGDTAGFPVTISQPGMYRLSGNLTLPNADTMGIVITSGAVTLDLNGFSIQGPVVCTSDPLACPSEGAGVGVLAGREALVSQPLQAIRVMNGNVHGMGRYGLLLTAADSSVEHVMAYSNGGDGISVNGKAEDCAASHNGGRGIVAHVIRRSFASYNIGAGIVAVDGGAMAVGNITTYNANSGVVMNQGVAAQNVSMSNDGFGIEAVCPSNLIDNTTIDNTTGAVSVSQAGCRITGNVPVPEVQQ